MFQFVIIASLFISTSAFSSKALEHAFEITWKSYDNVLTTSPILTKCGTSAVGFLIGDTIAQCMSKKGVKKLDLRRSLIMTSFGALVHAPFCHYLFDFMEASFPGKSVALIVTKIALDQVIARSKFINSLNILSNCGTLLDRFLSHHFINFLKLCQFPKRTIHHRRKRNIKK